MKKAYLVTFAPCTRVVVEENATEEEITEAARQQMCKEPEEYIIADTCTYCEEDTASPYNPETDDVEPDQPILFHPLDIPAPPGGRGFFGLEKGERITDINQIKRGDILLKYSPQFNANNVVKVTGERTGPVLRLLMEFWDPIKNISLSHDTFSIAGYSLNDSNADEFYKPAVKEKAEA